MKRRRKGQLVYRRLGADADAYYRRKKRRSVLRCLVLCSAIILIILLPVCVFLLHGEEEHAAGPGPVESETTETGESTEPEETVSGDGETEASTGTEETQPQDTEEPDLEWNYRSEERPKVKGIYVSGPIAGNEKFESLLTLVDETELNAMVIDVKNDAGEITYKMDLETARSAGACINYIKDMEGFVSRLKEHGVYTIARIVCFKDSYLAEACPDLALKTYAGAPVIDGDVAWVNPYKGEVWEYLVDVAKEAGKVGFDEIQFDYVRFPLANIAEQADYGVDTVSYTKQQAITDFLSYAVEELHPLGIAVTADVFGTIIGSEVDQQRVGQDYVEVSGVIDAICPMVYPSHYANGVFGLAVPDAQPYETIYAAMTDSVTELSVLPEEERAVVRPWLQAFTATWVKGHVNYGAREIRAQIQAVYDAGYEEWILWNASNRYSSAGLLEE